MNINKISFKANMFTGEAVVRNNNSVNLDGKKFETISNVTPQHNVIAPMSYSSLGVVKILDNVNVHLFKLANGQRVAIIPKEGTTKVCSYVNTGSMNEPDNVRGISHFIEHNLFNGSKGYGAGEIFKNVGKMGASSNASTGFSKTDYYISSNLIEEDDLENSIKMHASMLDSPRFAENMIEKEKGPVISEINMITDDSVNLAMNKTLKNLYGIKSTSSDLIGGNAENIKNLTREKLVDYYSKNYAPQNIVTVVSGEVEPEKTMKLLSKYFTRTASPVISQYSQEFNPIQKTIREDIFSDKTNSTMIIMGLNGANNIDMKESAELMIINNLLSEGRGSRINGKLIPLNATCEISTERMGTQKNSPNAILLCAKSTDDNAEKVLKKIYSGIDDLKNNTPTQEEIDNIKKSIKISQEEISENSNIINSVVGNVMMDSDLEELNKYRKFRDNLNVDDIKSALNKYYDLNKVALTVVHPNLKDKTVVQKNHANAINFTGKTVKKDLAKLDKANKYALANGATAITYKKNSQNASFSYSIKCPHSYGEKYMTSLILSSMLKNGSSYRDEKSFYSDLEKNNISLFTKVDDDEISFNAFGTNKDIKKEMDSMKELLENPRLTQNGFEKSKNLLKDIILAQTPSANTNLYKLLYPNLSEYNTPKEMLNELEEVSLDDVKNLYTYYMQNGTGVFTSLANDDTNKKLLSMANTLPKSQPLNVTKDKNIYYDNNVAKVVTEPFDLNQASVVQAYTFKKSENLKDKMAVTLLNAILGATPTSRLFNDLRENKKLAYRVNSDCSADYNAGIMKLKIKTTTENKDTGEVSYDNLKKSIEGFNEHVKKITTEDVTDEELENAKKTIKNDYLAMSYDEGLNLGIMTHYFFKNQPLDMQNKKYAMIDEITKDDIKKAAQYIFKNKPVTSVVASKNTLSANEEFLKTQGELLKK